MVIPHPKYNPAQFNNDIAILRLSTPATYTQYIQPICLWDQRKLSLSNVVNHLGFVIGFGLTETEKLADTLRTSQILVVSHEQCRKSDKNFFTQLNNGNFCAGYKNGKTLKSFLSRNIPWAIL